MSKLLKLLHVLSGAVLIGALVSSLLTLVFGALLLIGRPALINARWVWAKAGFGTGAATIAIFMVLPAVNQAAALARTGIETPSLMALAAALRSDPIGELALLALAFAAAVLGVWRPSLGKRRSES